MPPVSPSSRSGPLITWLVVFVILWVVCGILAIVYYVDANKAREDLDGITKQYSDILPKSQINSDDINKLKEMRSQEIYAARGFNGQMSVVDVLMKDRADLAERIGAANPDAAYKAAVDSIATNGAQAKNAKVASLPQNLTGAMNTLTQALVARQAEVDSLNAQLAQAQKTAVDASNQMQEQQKAFSKAMEEEQTRSKQASTTFDTDRSTKDEQIKKMIADAEAAQKQAQDQSAQLATQVADLTKKLTDTERLRDDALRKLGLKRANTSDSVIRHADGQIVRVPGNNTVYINLGLGDQIPEGLTFEVYDRLEGIPSAGDVNTDEALPKGKGAIEVIHVGAGSSECRIINEQPGMKIREGDLIANIIYDRNTKFRFFVYGDFDLDQNGVTIPADTEVVKQLVSRFGGKTADTINADTDFVILGKEPVVLIPTKEEASEPIIQAKAQASQLAYDDYQDVKKRAMDYHIPILNQNRFLYFVGYFEMAKR